MDRLLVSELPAVTLNAKGTPPFNWQVGNIFGQNWRALGGLNNYWMCEDIINLEGYQMKDMTAYFRQSFEQRGGLYSVNWAASAPDPLTSFTSAVQETVIISTVPFSDDNLIFVAINQPGFISIKPTTIDPGNFNRDMIIHGRTYLHGIDTVFGSDVFTANGSAYTRIVQQQDFSSLEPTATDKLYVYRVLGISDAGSQDQAGLTQVAIPPCRVILDTKFVKEEELPYLMRLKRGYELANQV